MKKLIIIRGLPGSGKTTLADQLKRALAPYFNLPNVEADQWFEDSDGNYYFDPKLLRSAHDWCQRMVEHYLNLFSICIVSNTFTTKKEIAPYIEMADMYLIIKCNGDWKSVHGVPEITLEKMRDRVEYQPFGMELDYWPPITSGDFEDEILSKVKEFIEYEPSKNFLSINTY